MFDFLGYKRRLLNVRLELLAILTAIQPIERAPMPVSLDIEADQELFGISKQLKSIDCEIGVLAKAVGDVCRILVRVIDSLPGSL